MRKSKAEAAQTRKRIVEVAAEEFRRKGIAGAGLVDLMATAGLTAGGFYRHFESKDALVAEALREACQTTAERLSSRTGEADPTANLAQALGLYLSTRHRDNADTGCPLVALGSELARSDLAVRQAATEGFFALVDLVAAGERSEAPELAARTKAMVAVATMIGALTMSRILTDPDASKALIDGARAQILQE